MGPQALSCLWGPPLHLPGAVLGIIIGTGQLKSVGSHETGGPGGSEACGGGGTWAPKPGRLPQWLCDRKRPFLPCCFFLSVRQTTKFPHRWLRNQNRTLSLAWGDFTPQRDHLTLQFRMQKLRLRTQAALGSHFQAPRKGPLDPRPRSDPALSGTNLNRQGSV